MQISYSLLLKLFPAYIGIILLTIFSFSTDIYKDDFRFINNINASTNIISEPDILVSGKPIRVVIPTVNLDLKVAGGDYHADAMTWELSETEALYATVSALPNNKAGNTLIYGHNTPQVFGNTKSLKIGDNLYLFTDNHYMFTYKFVADEEVAPNDTKIFTYDGPVKLTIQTCSGLFDLKRRLMQYDLVSVTSDN